LLDLAERLDALARARWRHATAWRAASALAAVLACACVLPMARPARPDEALRAAARAVLDAAREGAPQSCFTMQAAALVLADAPQPTPTLER
jgi:hypothetical protein